MKEVLIMAWLRHNFEFVIQAAILAVIVVLLLLLLLRLAGH